MCREHDAPRPDALGARGPHIILARHIEHAGARQPQDQCGVRRGERQARQQEIAQIGEPAFLEDRRIARARQPARAKPQKSGSDRARPRRSGPRPAASRPRTGPDRASEPCRIAAIMPIGTPISMIQIMVMLASRMLVSAPSADDLTSPGLKEDRAAEIAARDIGRAQRKYCTKIG